MQLDKHGHYVLVGGAAKQPALPAAPAGAVVGAGTGGVMGPAGVAPVGRLPSALTIAATMMESTHMATARPPRGGLLARRLARTPDVEAGIAPGAVQQEQRPVRFMIAHGRQTAKLERYANAYHTAVQEWEHAQVMAYVARERGQDPSVAPYGKLGVYKARRKRKPGKRKQAEEVDAGLDVPAAGATTGAAGGQPTQLAQQPRGGKHLTEKERRKEAGAKYTLAEAHSRIESRVRVRFLKLQMIRYRYGAEQVQESAYSTAHPSAAAGIVPAGIVPLPAAAWSGAPAPAVGGIDSAVPGVVAAGPGAAGEYAAPAVVGTQPAAATTAPQGPWYSRLRRKQQAVSSDTAYSEDMEEVLPNPYIPAPLAAGAASGVGTLGGVPTEAAIASVPVDMQQQTRAMEYTSASSGVLVRLRPDPRYYDYRVAMAAGVVPHNFNIRTPPADSAFVTFADAGDAAEVLRLGKACFAHGHTIPASAAVLEAYGLPAAGISRRSANYRAMSVQQAPEPAEMVWGNTTITPGGRVWRGFCSTILLAVVVFIAAVPAFCAAALSNLGPMASVIGFLEPVVSWSGIAKGLLQTLIPALIIRIIVALLRVFVMMIANYRGLISNQAIQTFTARWWFFASYLAAVVAYTVASTVLGSLDAIINNPSQVLFLLAQSLPQTSGTFIAFVIIVAVQGWSLELLRPVDLCMWVYCRKRQVTNRMLKAQLRGRAGVSPNGVYVPSAALILAIGLLYNWMNPALIPCILGYFIIASAVAPTQLLYVYDKPEELGGRFWVQAVNMSIGTLVFAQAIYIAYFIWRKVQTAGYLVIPLLVLTILVKMYWTRRFDRPLARLHPALARAVQETVAAQLLTQPQAQAAKAPLPLEGSFAASAGATGPAPAQLAAAESKGAPAAAMQGAGGAAPYQLGAAGEPREPFPGATAGVPGAVGAAGAAGAAGAGAEGLPGSRMDRKRYAATYRQNCDNIVQRLRGGQADITQWYLPDTCRPSPYVGWYWKEACDIQANGFDWTGDGACYPASRMKAWVPSTSGVPGAGDLPAQALLLPLRAHEGAMALPLEGGKLGEPPAQHAHAEVGGELSRVVAPTSTGLAAGTAAGAPAAYGPAGPAAGPGGFDAAPGALGAGRVGPAAAGYAPAGPGGLGAGAAGQPQYMAMSDVETQAWVFEEVHHKSLLAGSNVVFVSLAKAAGP